MTTVMHRVRSIRTVTLLATTLVVAAAIWAPQAQARRGPAPTWHRNAGESANAVATDKHGNAYIVGATVPGGQDFTLMIRKYAPDGSLLWARSWHPAKAGYVNGRDITVAPDGGVYVVGSVAPRGCEGSGWFIARYTPAGKRVWLHDAPEWEKCTTADTYGSVAVARGRLIVAGNRFGCCGDPFNHGYLRSYTTGGRPLWKTLFDAPGIDPAFYDGAVDVTATPSGMFFATGWTNTAVQHDDSDFVDQDVVIQGIDASGAVAWARVIGDRGKRDRDRGTAIAVRGGRLQVTADVDARTFVRSSAWLGALTLDGSLLWSKQWGATKKGNQSSTADVSISPQGATYVAGSRKDKSDGGWDLVMRKFGPGGTLIWQSVLEQGLKTLFGTGVAARSDGAFVTGTDEYHGGGHLWSFGN